MGAWFTSTRELKSCVTMFKLSLLLLVFTSSLSITLGSFGFRSHCIPVPSHLCAIAYDDGRCTGWKLEIPVGEQMFKWWDPVWYWYRNDIETVSVRAGCSFTGFDDSSYNGNSFTIRAGTADRHVELNDEDEFEDFDEAIQSYSCVCRNWAKYNALRYPLVDSLCRIDKNMLGGVMYSYCDIIRETKNMICFQYILTNNNACL